jgi:hypothetical protein
VPLAYKRDDARRRVTLTITGAVPVADILQGMERFIEDGTWTYRTLVDRREARVLSASETRLLAQGVRDFTERFGPPGRVAIVVHSVANFGQGRMFSLLVEEAGVEADVFSDMDLAEGWLSESEESV